MPLRPSEQSGGGPAIAVENLAKQFGDIRAVNGISFTVPHGSMTGLLGGNGAGKTTTIAILLGLVVPTAGTVRVLGVDIATDRFRALPWMNFSSPYVNLPRRLSVRENLVVYGHLYGVADMDSRIAELARDLDLEHLMARPVGTLSAGQATRVALAKALINNPHVLLLDEPTASLDPDTADWMRGYLDSYRRRSGASVLLASHNMTEVERLCDNALIMKNGRIEASGAPAELIARYGRQTLEEVFLAIARSDAAERVSP